MGALEDQPLPGWHVLGLDVEYVEDPAEFLTELTAKLLTTLPVRKALASIMNAPGAIARWLKETVESFDVGTPELGEVKIQLRDHLESRNWAELGEQLFEHVRHVEGSMLIIIDEFPMMMATLLDANPNEGTAFLKWFRAQRQATNAHGTRFLLGGSVNIEPRLEHLAIQSLLNDMERFSIKPLSREDSVRFVQEVLVTEGVNNSGAIAPRIYDCIGTGVHFFLQVLISECLSAARAKPSEITPDEVRAIYEARVLGPANRARFSHYHSRLKTNYGTSEPLARRLLADLARGECNLSALAAGYEDSELEDVLSRLEGDYYVIRERDTLRFHSAFLRDWWRQNLPGGK
jgi:hypothetical protein